MGRIRLTRLSREARSAAVVVTSMASVAVGVAGQFGPWVGCIVGGVLYGVYGLVLMETDEEQRARR